MMHMISLSNALTTAIEAEYERFLEARREAMANHSV